MATSSASLDPAMGGSPTDISLEDWGARWAWVSCRRRSTHLFQATARRRHTWRILVTADEISSRVGNADLLPSVARARTYGVADESVRKPQRGACDDQDSEEDARRIAGRCSCFAGARVLTVALQTLDVGAQDLGMRDVNFGSWSGWVST
jgi:hypothetical protein